MDMKRSSLNLAPMGLVRGPIVPQEQHLHPLRNGGDRKSTRLNSSHSQISYAVLCLKKTNALGLGDQAQQGAIGVEAPGPAGRGDLDAGLAVAVEQLAAETAGGVIVGHLDAARAVRA